MIIQSLDENSELFRLRNYSEYKTFDLKYCVICDREFYAPKRFKGKVTTCCKYCSQIVNSLIKIKGIYLLCKLCDKPIWVTPSQKNIRVYCSKNCKHIGQSIYPSNLPEVIQTGRKKYYGPNWLKQRDRARKRDNYTCQKCGTTEEELGQQLSVHHKKTIGLF